MQTARCIEDGKIYSAIEFAQLPATDFDHLKMGLQCPKCNGPAVFRRSSRNYGAPCFRGQPHAAGCTLSSQDECADDQDGDFGNATIDSGTVIVVDFNYGGQNGSEHIETDERGSSRSRTSDGYFGQPVPFVQRRLSSLLRILIDNPAVGQSDQLIKIQGWEEIAAKDLFVPLHDVTEQYAGLYRAYWGLVRNAGIAPDGALWLNSEGPANFSFCIQPHHLNEIARRFPIKKTDDLADAHVLVFGAPKFAQSGKFCCIVADPDCMALRLR